MAYSFQLDDAEDKSKLPLGYLLKDNDVVETLSSLILADEKTRLFHDQKKDAMIYMDNRCVNVSSKTMKNYIAHFYYEQYRKPLSNEKINQVVSILSTKAIFHSPEIKLFNRVAFKGDTIFYNLGDKHTVKISPEGWNVVEPPVLFRYHAHEQTQVKPVESGGDAFKILELVRVNEDYHLLAIVFLVSCFIPGFAHPLLYPFGAEGSGKSMFSYIVKQLVDPSEQDLLIMPRRINELVQQLSHHHLICYNNVSAISLEASDVLCQAVTGGAFSKKMLYTDDNDFFTKINPIVVINGISHAINKSDLMDRALLIKLERIPDTEIVAENEFKKQFEEIKPIVLGGIFDVIVDALKIYKSVKINKLERLADFTKWGYAIA